MKKQNLIVFLKVTNAPRPSTERTYSNALPEIQNIFRAPEKRPPETISLGFAGAVLVPILVLFVGVSLLALYSLHPGSNTNWL